MAVGSSKLSCALVAGSLTLLSHLRVSEADEPRPGAVPFPEADSSSDSKREQRLRERTILSIEAVTHAPVDVGIQAGYEAPFGLRLFGGYGWVPRPFISAVTDVAASAIGDSRARSVLSQGEYGGNTWRVQAGLRPFSGLGLYLDAGYSKVMVDGSLELSDSGVRELEGFDGGYTASLDLDMWLVELGYQGQIFERIVVGSALGVMRTMRSTTIVTPTDGAPTSASVNEATQEIDRAIESYGFVPTLTLRLGVDLI
jgi:hypothetical protein